jgi:cytochrome P450
MVINLESLVSSLVAIVLAFFIFLYFYFTRNFNFWKKYGIPYLKPTPFIGNLKKVFFQQLDINTHLKDIYNEHKDKPYVGIFSFDRPTLIVNDLELVKNVLVKDSQNFVDRIVDVDETLDPLFAKILFSLKGQKWRNTRVNVTPTFTSGKMKKMVYIVEKCAKELCDYLDRTTVRGK